MSRKVSPSGLKHLAACCVHHTTQRRHQQGYSGGPAQEASLPLPLFLQRRKRRQGWKWLEWLHASRYHAMPAPWSTQRAATITEPHPRMRTYAIGDIHGRADLLAEMHRLIDQDLRSYSNNATVIYLGDYVDRGADTKGVLEQLINSTVGTSRVFLKGNHEEMLLEFLAHPKRAQRWLSMGGKEAAQSYGVEESDPRRVATGLAASVPSAHMDFLRRLEVSHSTDLYFFCHAGVRPGIALAKQDAHDLMWIKGDFLNSDEKFEKIIVHGHSPVDEVDIRANRINVDTRAYATGRLSCVVLDGDQVRVLATQAKASLRARLRAWLKDWLD